MLTTSSLRHLFLNLGTVRLSAASQAVLQSTCRACRSLQQPPGHDVAPAIGTAFSDLAQTDQLPVRTFKEFFSLQPEQRSKLSWPIAKDKHLSSRIMMARNEAAKSMLDSSSAAFALDKFLKQLKGWFRDHPNKFNSISAALGLLSIAHLAKKAQGFHTSSPLNPLTPIIAASLMKMAVHRLPEASNHSVCNVLWACARLNMQPDTLHPGSADKLGQRFIATQSAATHQGASNVLWACGSLKINPGNGVLLFHLLQLMHKQLAQPADNDDDATAHMQSLSMTMCALAMMRLHIKPSLAELFITRFYEGLVAGADEPQGLINVLWACASLGYLPPPHMLQRFKESYASSKKPFVVQHDSTMLWCLAVMGFLDMEFFKTVMLRLPRRQRMHNAALQQVYQALQSLRPSDESTAAYTEWSEVTRHVQREWPLGEDTARQSPFEMRIFYTLLQMGYQASAHYDSGDGLHVIDIALLPQAKVPCKIAVEVDGNTHFLYEDYRLDRAPKVPTRSDGRTLFRNSVLERHGWRVLTVPWYEWHPLTTKNAQFGYLAKKMREVVAQHKVDTQQQQHQLES